MEVAETTRLRRIAARLKPRPEAAQSRPYVPKFEWTQLPDMLSPEFPDSVWKDWEQDECPLDLKMDSWIDTDALLNLAGRYQFPHMNWVTKWVDILKEGARTGVMGAGRLPLDSVRNSPSLATRPVQVLDQLRAWTKQGILCGPIKPEDMPPGAKHAPLSVVDKPPPSEQVRLINNQSYPHYRDPEVWSPTPISFNAGINAKDYPTKQITSKHVLVRLRKVGAGSYMCKVDWSDAVISITH